jgi:hypothetical protein
MKSTCFKDLMLKVFLKIIILKLIEVDTKWLVVIFINAINAELIMSIM